jgi:sec-independent protein translocase protein TatA
MNLGPTELIIILVIVVLLFGVGRLSKIGREMGSGIREFRTGLQGDDKKDDSEKKEDAEKTDQTPPPANPT